jgi:hypothetical protein
MTDPDYHKFIADNLISPGGGVSFDNFTTIYMPVEKYLPDNASLSAGTKAETSYLTENQRTIEVVFTLGLQNI